ARDGAGGAGGGCPMTRDGGAAGGAGRGGGGGPPSFGAVLDDLIVRGGRRGGGARVGAPAVHRPPARPPEGNAPVLEARRGLAGARLVAAPGRVARRGQSLTVGRGLSPGRAP